MSWIFFGQGVVPVVWVCLFKISLRELSKTIWCCYFFLFIIFIFIIIIPSFIYYLFIYLLFIVNFILLLLFIYLFIIYHQSYSYYPYISYFLFSFIAFLLLSYYLINFRDTIVTCHVWWWSTNQLMAVLDHVISASTCSKELLLVLENHHLF